MIFAGEGVRWNSFGTTGSGGIETDSSSILSSLLSASPSVCFLDLVVRVRFGAGVAEK